MTLDTHNKKVRSLFSLLTLCVVALCFYLSFNLFQLSTGSRSLNNSLVFLKHNDLTASQALNKQAEGLREQYGFMVFEKEKAQLERQLIRSLQKQINLQPFDSKLWRELTFLQANRSLANKKQNVDSLQWEFLVTKQLLQWNPHERGRLLSHCSMLVIDLHAEISNVCKEMFVTALQTQSLEKLARNLKLSIPALQRITSHFGLARDKVADDK